MRATWIPCGYLDELMGPEWRVAHLVDIYGGWFRALDVSEAEACIVVFRMAGRLHLLRVWEMICRVAYRDL